jgi:hypothetical protein
MRGYVLTWRVLTWRVRVRAQAVPAMFGGGIATAFAMKGAQALLAQRGGKAAPAPAAPAGKGGNAAAPGKAAASGKKK